MMKRQLNLRHRRSNTEQSLNYNKKQKAQPSVQDQSSENAFSIGSIDQPHEVLFYFQNSQNRLAQRYSTYPNDQELHEGSIPNRVKQLMKGLKQLIQELCLTKNASQEIQQELEKIINSFSQAILFTKNPTFSNKYPLSNTNQNRNHVFFQKNANLNHNVTQTQIPWTNFFATFLQGTIYQDQQKQNKQKISSYQEDLLQEFMDTFFNLLQKQINRITKYNGQKKLKFLLQTVMKQVFIYLMRFSYDTRIEMFKKQKKNYLNNPVNKIKVFASTIQRILNAKRLRATAFTSIRSLVKGQRENDTIVVNKFEGKISFLDKLIQMRERKELRQTFFEWRKNSIVQKQMEKQVLLSNVSHLIREIIHDFALNECDMEKWKVCVWTRLNDLMRKICKFGQVIVFPVDEQILYGHEGKSKSGLSSVAYSRVKSHGCSESFRYSPSSVDSEQDYENQRKILDYINQLFTSQEIKTCMKNGQIIINQNYQSKIILIPVKAVSGIIAIQTPIDQSIQSLNDNPDTQMNANTFYTILNALDLLAPSLLEILQLREKFQYFLDKIKSNHHHKFILSTLLEPNSHQISSHPQNDLKSIKHNKRNLAFSQLLSFTNRSHEQEKIPQKQSFSTQTTLVQSILQKLKAQSFIVYHKTTSEKTQACLQFPLQGKNGDSLNTIGSEIIDAIMSELQKLNKNSYQQIKCLELKRTNHRFYVCPLLKNQHLIGFIQIYLTSHPRDDNFKNKESRESAFVVKAVDERNENFNEGIQFLVNAILPALIKQKQNHMKRDTTTEHSNNACKHCFSYAKSESKNQHYFDGNTIKSLQKTINLNQTNQIFSKYTLISSNKQLFLQKALSKFIQKELHDLNKIQISSNKSQGAQTIMIPHDSVESLIDRQVFVRVFYLENAKTKDGKVYSMNKKELIDDKTAHLYCINLQKTETRSNKAQKIAVDMQFMNILGLFKQKKAQRIEVTVNSLIQVYKKMIRKDKTQSKSSNKTNQPLQKKDFEIFLEQILKSVNLRNANESQTSMDQDKRYHSLQLLLYQLEHWAKNNEKQKFKFVLMLNPVFSLLDEKHKYLTGVVCLGGFVLSNQMNDKMGKKIKLQSKLMHLNQAINSFNTNILSKFIWLHNKVSALPQIPPDIIQKQLQIIQKDTFAFNQIQLFPLQHLSQIQAKQKNIYNGKQPSSNNLLSAVFYLQRSIQNSQKNHIKNTIIPQFRANLKSHSIRILDQMYSIIQSKIIDKRFTIKTRIYSSFINNLKYFIQTKEQNYSINCLKMLNTLHKVFVINKIFKTTFNTLKHIPFVNKNFSKQSATSASVSAVKIFAVQRIAKTIKQKLFNDESTSKTICRYAFDLMGQYSQDSKKLSLLQKKKSLFLMENTLRKLICEKGYMPYFQHLQSLEKSLSESISLIGAQVQSIDFYSIYQFLRFIHQRISIILNSEKKLINVLYGNSIHKVLLQIIVQTKNDNSFFKLLLSQKSHQKLYHSENQPAIFNQNHQHLKENINNLIQIFQNQDKILYFSFKFVEDQQQTPSRVTRLDSLKHIVRKVFELNVVPAFNKFYTLYEKKIKGFALKLSKVFKIKTHFSLRRNCSGATEDEENLQKKRFAFRKLESQITKINQIKRVKQISSEAQRKQKELEQLQSHFDNRAKKLTSQQVKDLGENDDEGNDKIVTRGMIKGLKQRIQVLDQNSEILSLQYQIKSKTVASYQIIGNINQRQRKEALRQVAMNILNNEIDNSNIYEVILDEKQKLKYRKAQFDDEKSESELKLRKAGTRSMVKVLGNLNKSACKKVFYSINSFSCITALKHVR